MVSDINREKIFSRRAFVLGGIKSLLMLGVTARLFYLQISQANKYEVLAEENRINLKLIPPVRGEILDRNKVALALNKENFRIILVPEQALSLEETLKRLKVVMGLTETERERVLKEAKRRRGFVPIMVRENLTWDEVARLEVNTLELPGVSIEVGSQRFYPFKEVTSHLVGYVGKVSTEELQQPGLLQLTDYRVGKTGLEKEFDSRLSGEAGAKQMEVNAVGRIIRELRREPGKTGDSLDLTIDVQLQNIIYDKVGDQVASVTVMNAHTGAVHALVGAPGYDPNLFHFGVDVESWQELQTNPRRPLLNRIVSGQYAPASTFKMIVALTALKEGWTPGERVYCPGHYNYGDTRFHCWKEEGHGKLDLYEAIAQSCDVYFYELSRQLGIDKIAAMARTFGLGTPTGIQIPAEVSGLVPDRQWKRKALNRRWQKGETLIAGIGQGYLLATPIQLAVMTAQMVNGGYSVTPKLLQKEVVNNMVPPESIGVPKSHLDIVMKGMDMATNAQKGTAYWHRIRTPEYRMGGKTGTAQVKRISLQEREDGIIENKDRQWFLRDHALYVGYAPLSQPKYVVSVVVEHGGGGSAVAAPIAHEALYQAQKILGV